MMHTVFEFLRGPMAGISVAVFIIGCLYQIAAMARLAWKKDRVVFHYFSLFYALRSIVRWLTPYATLNMRKHPVMTAVTFVFHLCLFAVPLFLSSHIILVKESWDISWIRLPDGIADAMGFAVLGACGFFLGRRIFVREARYLTTIGDVLILVCVAAPFFSGVWAYHQWPGFPVMTLIHMASGEMLLMLIPFTRLRHMLFFPMIRGYMGSEFGGVRRAKDW